MGIGLTLICHMADSHPQYHDIAPLRLVSWVSCEVPFRVQQVLKQLMILFGAVTPVSSRDRSSAVRGDCQRGAFLGYDHVSERLISLKFPRPYK